MLSISSAQACQNQKKIAAEKIDLLNEDAIQFVLPSKGPAGSYAVYKAERSSIMSLLL